MIDVIEIIEVMTSGAVTIYTQLFSYELLFYLMKRSTVQISIHGSVRQAIIYCV